MSQLLIEKDIINWLNIMTLLSTQQNSLVKYKNGQSQYEILPPLSNQFENGIVFGKLAHKLINMNAKGRINNNVQIDIQQLKDFNSPAARLFNWNKLQDIYRKHLNIVLDQDLKSLIVAGDQGMINDFLKEIYSIYSNKNQSQLVKQAATQQTQSQIIDDHDYKKLSHKGKQDVIDINNINLQKDLLDSDCLLEFFVLNLCRNLHLKPKQAASLLTKNAKYLAHIIVKGVKNQYEPIIQFYQDFYRHTEKVVELLNLDSKNQSLFYCFQSLQPGLLSKSSEVALWCSNLLQKLALECMKSNLYTDACNWFFSENQGLGSCLLGLKRHNDLVDSIVNTMLTFGRFNFIEMFTLNLKKELDNQVDLLLVIKKLLKPLYESAMGQEELMSSGVIDNWIQESVAILDDIQYCNNYQLLVNTLSFLVEIWLLFPSKMEEQEQTVGKIIKSLKTNSSTQSQLLNYTCVTLMFRLLEQFGKSHSNFAPYIYKTLTIILVESYSDINMRQLLFSNFQNIFEQIEGIPLGILLEPYLKQLQMAEKDNYKLNTFDLEFYVYISKSNKLQLKNGIQFLDLLAKIYLNNVVQAPVCGQAILSIIIRNIEQDAVQQFMIKFIKIGLAMFFSSERKKKNKEKALPMYNQRAINPTQDSQNMSLQEMEQEVINAQKRALIVEIIRQIIKLDQNAINEKVKPLVAHTNIQLKQAKKKNNKAMMSLLNEFGNSEQIISEYEVEYYEQIQKEQETVKQQQESQDIDSSSKQRVQSQANLYSNRSNNYNKFTKAEMTKLALLRNPKADPKILRHLKDIQQKNVEKSQKEVEDQKVQLVNTERQKQSLRKQLEKRSIEQGVSVRNQYDVSSQKLLYPEGTREKDYLKEKVVDEIEPLDLENEELIVRDMVESLFYKYKKVIKHLFDKYSNTGFSLKNMKGTFDQQKLKYENINIAELYNMIKEHGYQNRISLEELTLLARSTNVKILKIKDEVQSFSQENFRHFLFQLAVFCNKNIQHMPCSYQFQQMINDFRDSEKKRGVNTVLYDDPHSTTMADRELLKEFNEKLKKDPDYNLPDGFKVIQQKEFEIEYKQPASLLAQIDDKYQVVYELINDLLKEKINVDINEYQIKKSTIHIAQPQIFDVVHIPKNRKDNPKQNYMSEVKKEDRKKETKEVMTSKQKIQNSYNRHLDIQTKLAIQQFSKEDRRVAEECAFVLEDILHAVEKGYDKVARFNQIENKYLEQQKFKQNEEKIRLQQFNKRIQMRRLFLIKKYGKKDRDAIYVNKKRLNQKKKRKYKGNIGIPEFGYKKKENVTRSKQLIIKPTKDLNYLKLIKGSRRQQERKLRKERYLFLKARKDEFEKFNEEQINKYEKLFDISTKKQKKQEREKAEQEQKDKQKIVDYNRNVLPKMFERDQQKIQLHRENSRKIDDHFYSQEIQEFIKDHLRQFQYLFKHYVLSEYTPLNINGERTTVGIHSYLHFVNDFDICPGLLNYQQIILLYNTLIREKPNSDGVQEGLNFQEFLESLIRISIKSDKVLSQVSNKIQNITNKEQLEQEVDNILDNNEEKNNQSQDLGQVLQMNQSFQIKNIIERNMGKFDEYLAVDEFNVNKLEALYYLLDIPDGKNLDIQKSIAERGDVHKVSNTLRKKQMVKRLENNINNNQLAGNKSQMTANQQTGKKMKNQILDAISENKSQIR